MKRAIRMSIAFFSPFAAAWYCGIDIFSRNPMNISPVVVGAILAFLVHLYTLD